MSLFKLVKEKQKPTNNKNEVSMMYCIYRMGTWSNVRDGTLDLHLQNSKEILSLGLCIWTYVPWIFRLGHLGGQHRKGCTSSRKSLQQRQQKPSFIYSKPKQQSCGTMPKRAQCVR